MAAWLDEWTQISATRLHDFNRLDDDAARELLSGCLDIDRWVDRILAKRPYAGVDDLLDVARHAAKPFTDDEIEQICPHRTRDDGRRTTVIAAAAFAPPSTGCLRWDARTKLVGLLDDYEQRFGRSFVIRRMGRSGAEIMEKLEARLANDVSTENRVVAGELRQIALLRLAKQIPV